MTDQLRAAGRDRPVGMIHIDAHRDTGGVFEGECAIILFSQSDI